MSRTISYKGKLPIGEQERIKLSTPDGKTGYKIKTFEVIPGRPGQDSVELIGQIFKTNKVSNITTTVDFTNSDLLGFAYYEDNANNAYPATINRIFDNEKFNQDIFVNITDASSGTDPANYYIELEAMPLSDIEATKLTLQSLRTITS
tara:strand:- start:41 stop:484 length:444 start_codon:yes stop_codon:yes gene_type:complete